MAGKAAALKINDKVVEGFNAQEDRDKWTPGSRFLRSGRPDQDGRFKLSGLPPGQYYLIALDYLDQDGWTEPEYLERVRNRATSVSINEGESKSVDLRITPAS